MTDVTAPVFSAQYQIYINHTDAGGIVYHANHLVFFENCRRDYLTKLGFNTYFLTSEDGNLQHFVVSQIDIKYQKAILLDELITVQIDHIEVKPASLIFHQSIHRKDDKNATSTVLSRAKIVIACVENQAGTDSAASGSIKPIRVPKVLHDSIAQSL